MFLKHWEAETEEFQKFMDQLACLHTGENESLQNKVERKTRTQDCPLTSMWHHTMHTRASLTHKAHKDDLKCHYENHHCVQWVYTHVKKKHNTFFVSLL